MEIDWIEEEKIIHRFFFSNIEYTIDLTIEESGGGRRSHIFNLA